MNVNITWQGTDITQHVIEYTRQHDICTGVGSLDLIIEGGTSYDFNPWNLIVIKEDGIQVAKYNITSTEKTAPGGTYIIAAQDNSKRLSDYFLDTQYTSEGITYTKYWLELILNAAGVSYSINVSESGEPVTAGSSFGMQPAYDSVLSLLQMSGWYMYFDSNGVCQIGQLDGNKTPKEKFSSSKIISIKKTWNDKDIRNRVYVWGAFDEPTQSWVHASAETYLGWLRDDGEDYRTIVYSNPSIYFYSSALNMANKILATFTNESSEKLMEAPGFYPNLKVGDYIESTSEFGYFVGQITGYTVNVNSSGAITTFNVDKKCPRLFGYSDIKGEYVYIGTNTAGVYRKALTGGTWYAYNTNITNKNITDLVADNTLLAVTTASGELYYTHTGGWTKYDNPISSGYFVACSVDRSGITFGGMGKITVAIDVFPSGTYLASGIPLTIPSGATSWITSITSEGVPNYLHQVYYEKDDQKFKTIAVLDLETNDLGLNLLSTMTTASSYFTLELGSYNHRNNSPYYVGRNIYNSLPPAGGDGYINPTDWGDLQNLKYFGDSPFYYYTGSGIFMGYYYYTINYHVTPPRYDIMISDGYIDTNGQQFGSDVEIALGENYPPGFNSEGRFIKISDNIYHTIGSDNYYDYIYEFNTASQTYSKFRQIPKVSVGELGLRPQETGWSGETFTNHYVDWGATGNDGDWCVILHWTSITSRNGEHFSGGGNVRVINIKNGSYTDYGINLPGRRTEPPLKDTPWVLHYLGTDESPNHVLYAFMGQLIGGGEGVTYDVLHPTFYVWVFVIDKYTGHVGWDMRIDEPNNGGTYAGIWNFYGLSNSWGDTIPSFPGDTVYHQHDHRKAFIRVMREHVENGYGHALLHVPVGSENTVWSYDPTYFWPVFIPHWGWHHYGYWMQSWVYYISIPEGTLSIFENYEDGKWGNNVVDPPITEGSRVLNPPWIFTPLGEESASPFQTQIQATYSRILPVCPTVFGMMRLSSENTDQYSMFCFDSPYNNVYITGPSELYTTHPTDGYRITQIHFVDSMLDCTDDSVYITGPHPASEPTGNHAIYGFHRLGYVQKTILGGNGSVGQGWHFSEPGGGWSNWQMPNVLFNSVLSNAYHRCLNYWLASGVYHAGETTYRILLHDSTVSPDGKFTTLFEYNRPMYLETGLGLPTVVYDKPASGLLGGPHSTLLGTSYTNSGNPAFEYMHPTHDIYDARLVNIFGDFSALSGETLPVSSINKFIGVTTWNGGDLLIYNTEPASQPDSPAHVMTISGNTKYLDFTNYFESPYVFLSFENPTSGTQFFQRNQNSSIFYNYSSGIPAGSKITIIRADDRI